jgi:polar amino acid transport system ATP-binding protein
MTSPCRNRLPFRRNAYFTLGHWRKDDDIRCNRAVYGQTFPKANGVHVAEDLPVIEIDDLHKSYGELEVLKGVSLSAPQGHVISLIGSSGSGKSTLLRCANLLEDSQKGEIRFRGEAVRWKGAGAGRHPADRAQITRIRTNLSMVFQQFNLWAHMTILQNVMEAPVTVLGRDREEVEQSARAYLDKVGIGDKCDAYPAMLSGGQQQRAAIARALCMEPTALLFDEPTSALDPELEQEVVRVIRALAEEGRTMLIVTHDMRMARDVSEHVIFLHNGQIEEQGPPERLFTDPQSERLKGFLSVTAA